MPTDRIKATTKNIAEAVVDRVEDTLQNEKERYIKYKASVKTSIFLAQMTPYWSKRATQITKGLLVLLGIGGSSYFMYLMYKRWQNQRKMEKVRISKRNKRMDTLCKIQAEIQQNKVDKNIEELHTSIEKMTIEELIAAMKASKILVVDVLCYFQEKTIEAHKKYNQVAEFIMEARVWAEELDRKDKKDGLLFGLPIDLKDHYALKGYDCVLGLTNYISKPMKDDSVIVKVLREHGAIPFVKSNVPQMMMSYDCDNPVYGETLNPLDESRTCGGSSGGSGVMVGSGSCLIGFGSDLAGSLRCPAHYCGIATLKMTSDRISDKGYPEINYDKGTINASFGPMCKSVDGLVLASRALLSKEMFRLDSSCAPIIFQEEVFNSKTPLQIGMYTFDGLFEASPPCVRAVECARICLEKAGHKVIMWQPFGTNEAIFNGIFYSMFNNRNGILDILKHEEKLSTAALRTYMLFKMPYYVAKGLAFALSYVDPWKARILNTISSTGNLQIYVDKLKALRDYRDKILSSWDFQKMDAVICPAMISPALLRTNLENVMDGGTYLSLYNSLDFPAGIVPVTKITDGDIEATSNYPNSDAPQAIYKDTKESIMGALGFPVGVQCACRPYREELCLRIMKDIEAHREY